MTEVPQEVFEPAGPHDHRLALGPVSERPLLGALNRAGVLEAGDLHVADRVAHLAGETDELVLLAVALAVRAVRSGSVCVDLSTVAARAPHLSWPEPEAWRTAILASPLVAAQALQVEGDLVYLDRYHRLETQVLHDLLDRVTGPQPDLDEAALAAALARVRGAHLSAEQEEAVVRAVRQSTTVLTGGPGTGKTTTIARLLVLLADQAAARGARFSVALAAPTGKAATRLQEAVVAELARLGENDRERVGRPEALTLHRLLGWRADNATRFRHDRTNRLSYDLVVVDESSMVELTMMARLLEAVRPSARLVLVGDPRQLTSVGAGAVLADVVAGFDGDPASPVVALSTNFRATADIVTLAEALRGDDAGVVDAEAVLAALRVDSPEVSFAETENPAAVLHDELLATALAVRAAAEAGDARSAVAALDEHRLLCAHREGPYGVRQWNHQVERWLGEATEQPFLGQGSAEWYAGRPLLVTSNDYALEVYNGETGVAVRQPDGRLRVVISGSETLHDFAPGRLGAIETMHAMTIHKSQGSQARRVSVLLPEPGSRLLTRELFYTAVTRAQQHVRVVGSEAAVRAAVSVGAERASGLRQRLRAVRPAPAPDSAVDAAEDEPRDLSATRRH